jgi:hypothetical protein
MIWWNSPWATAVCRHHQTGPCWIESNRTPWRETARVQEIIGVDNNELIWSA